MKLTDATRLKPGIGRVTVSVGIPSDAIADIRAAAEREEMSVSGFIADAAMQRARRTASAAA